jgi:hypothetical protein
VNALPLVIVNALPHARKWSTAKNPEGIFEPGASGLRFNIQSTTQLDHLIEDENNP